LIEFKQTFPYILDSFSLLTFLKNEPGAEIVERLLHETAKGKVKSFVNVVNVAELFYIIARKKGEEQAQIINESLKGWGLKVLEADLQTAILAAKAKTKYAISLLTHFA